MANLQTSHEIVSDKSKNAVVSTEFIKHGSEWLDGVVNTAVNALNAKADKTYVDAELTKKATTEAVATVDAKVNGKADANVVSQLQATVNTKADASTVSALSERVTANTTKTVDLQSQIDNLVVSGTGDSNPEVVQARTDTSGVTHATLKTRIDTEVTNLKSDLSLLNVEVDGISNEIYDKTYVASDLILGKARGAIISTETGSEIAFDGTTNTTHYYIEVKSGEKYYVQSRNRATLEYHIAFCDSSNVVLALGMKGNKIMRIVSDIVTIPEGCARLYVSAQDVSGPADWNPNSQIMKLSLDIAKINDIDKENERIDKLNYFRGNVLDNAYNSKYLSNDLIHGLANGACNASKIGSTIAFNTATNWRHYNIDVEAGEQYYVTVRHVNPDYYSIVYTDENNVVITRELNGTDEIETIKDYYTIVPKGAVKMYVSAQDVSGPADWNPNSQIKKVLFSVPIKKIDGLNTAISRVAKALHDDLQRGYFNDDGTIHAGNTRIVTKTYFPVKKGDKIRCTDNRLGMLVKEYSSDMVVTATSGWYFPVYNVISGVEFGDYTAKNDGYVRMQFYVLGHETEDINLSDFDHISSVIHIKTDNAEQIAQGRKWITSKSSKKYDFVTTEVSLWQQSMTMIDDKLWVFCDDYEGTENSSFVEIINTNGEKEKNIYTDFGHANATSFDAKHRNLLFAYEGYNTSGDSRKHMYIYHEPDANAERLSINDANCTKIYLCKADGTTEIQNGSSVTWGADRHEIIVADDEPMRTGERKSPVFYKVQLGMGDNDLSTDGYGIFVAGKSIEEYNGTCRIVKRYDGFIYDGVDVKLEHGNYACINDMHYDGFLYAGVDTALHNYLIFDFDDESESYQIIGNYYIDVHDDNYNSLHLEPEGITMNSDATKIYTSSRNTSTGDSIIIEFSK